MQAWTIMTLIWAVYHQHPHLQLMMPKATSLMVETQADVLFKRRVETHRILQQNLLVAEEKQPMFTCVKAIRFAVGERVWLSA